MNPNSRQEQRLAGYFRCGIVLKHVPPAKIMLHLIDKLDPSHRFQHPKNSLWFN